MNDLTDKFLTIQGWMLDLGLSNNELMCFAVINGFSQDDESMMKGGLSYLQKWLNVSRPTVISILKKLLDKGYIERTEVILRDGKHVFYRVVKNFYQGRLRILTKVGKETLPSNINKEIYNGKEEKRLSNDNQKKDDISFEDFYELYPVKRSRKPAEMKWKSLSIKDKKAAIEVLPLYIADCEKNKRIYKHPSTYLNQRTWEDDFTSEEKEEKEEIADIPANDAIAWERCQQWMRENTPRIATSITYEMFASMRGMVHFKGGLYAEIIREIEASGFDSDIVVEFERICQTDKYRSRIWQ